MSHEPRSWIAMPYLNWGCLVAIGVGFVYPPDGTVLQLCAFFACTGLPCPGCGLTRSVASFLHGHWANGFAYHPFGIVMLLAMLILASCVIPRVRRTVGGWADAHEQAVHRGTLGLALGMALFGLWRLWQVLHP